ncbi:MAG: ice-binding family protein, partial [Prolixibacteraceae bacterium]|nr:ice-binding family protein [Prolixibacteraceae bacterium]
MKHFLLCMIFLVALTAIPNVNFGQAPNLGAASSFVVFTSAGAFNNTGPSVLTGDVGSYTSSPVGLAIFPDPPAPGIVINGSIYGPAPSPSLATLAQQAAVISAYDQLDAVSCGTTLVLPLAGQILTPGAYCYGAAATLNGEITLDGLGDPNALFIIKIGGALATVGGSNVKLINGASPNNVYWQIGGEFILVDNSAFRGNVIGSGAITMLGTATFAGRALTKAGAISIAANRVTLALTPVAPTITLIQPTCALATGTITITAPTEIGMTYSIDGTTYTNTTGIFSGLASDTYNVTAMNLDGFVSPATSVTINAAPVGVTASLTSQVNVLCFGSSTGSVVITPSGGTAPYSITPAQTGLSAGLHTFTVTDANLCTTTVNATITQPATVLSASLTSQVNVLCFGNSNGSVVITPSGGTAPYSMTPAQT